MSQRDKLDLCAADQAVTAAAASASSHQKPDANLDFGAGRPIYAHVRVKTALTDGGSNTGTDVYIRHATNAALSSSAVDGQLIGSLVQAAAAGARLDAQVNPGTFVGKEYVGFYFDPQGANLTGGTIDAWFDEHPHEGTKEFTPPYEVQ